MDGDQYSADMGVLWAAYKAGSFAMPKDMTQEDFVKAMEAYFANFANIWVVDDRNPSFAKAQGQVGLVMTNSVDLIVEAKFGFFKWASKRNILRGTAAFLNMVRNSTKTGICMVRTSETKRVLPDHLEGYGLLFYIGKVSPTEYLYSIRGRAS